MQLVFAELAHELTELGINATADSRALFVLATAHVLHDRAAALIAKTDVMIAGRSSADGARVVRNPATTIVAQQARVIRQLSSEFGLTPSARTRIDVERGYSDDELNPFAWGG